MPKLSSGLLGLFKQDKVRPNTSAYRINKRLIKSKKQASGGTLTKQDRKMLRKDRRVLSGIESGKMSSKRLAKQVRKDLIKEDIGLKDKYVKSVKRTLRAMKSAAASNIDDDDSQTQTTPAGRRRASQEALKKKKKMWARAREARREEHIQEVGATRSIGRKDLEKAAVSMSEVQRRKRASQAQQPASEKKTAVDIMID